MSLSNIKVNNSAVTGVDNEPTAGNDNLVKSGGTEKAISIAAATVKLSDFTLTNNRRIDANGAIHDHGTFKMYTISNNGFAAIYTKTTSGLSDQMAIAFYSGETVGTGFISGVVVKHIGSNYAAEEYEYSAKVPSTCKIIAVCSYSNVPDIYADGNIKEIVDSITVYNCHSTQETFTEFQTNQAAREAVPSGLRKRGLILKYKSEENADWILEIFNGPYYVPANRSYFSIIPAGHLEFKYLGDITKYITGTGQSATCSYNPTDFTYVGNNNPEPYNYGKFYFGVTIPAETKVTFTYLNQNGNPFTVNNPEKYAVSHLIYKNLTSYNAFILPINGTIKEIIKYSDSIKAEIDKIGIRLNPKKNVFDEAFLVDDINCVVTNGQTWSLNEEVNAKTLIMPLYDYGDDVYVYIGGFSARKYTTNIIFLDKDMNPVPNGGVYNIGAAGGETKIRLFTASYNLHKYIAITLYKGVDYGNTNPENGYVWSEGETRIKRPSWFDNVFINFVQGIEPNKIIKSKKFIVGDAYDEALHSENADAKKLFSEHLISNNDVRPTVITPRFNFLFSTDHHTDKSAASLRNVSDMLEFAEDSCIANEIDCIINNGDVATPNYTITRQQAINEYDTYYAIVKKSVVPFIQVVGNHDKHQESNVLVADALTNREVRTYLVQNTNHVATTLYQTYNFAEKKIRVIKLDGFDYPLESDTNGKVKYPLDKYDCYLSQIQLEWFVGNLLATPEGYDVLVCGHIHKDSLVASGIEEILTAYNNRANGSTTIDYSEVALEMPVPSTTVNYDFGNITNSKIVAFMLGHNHRDSMQVINGINVIGTACQYLNNDYGTGAQSSRFAYTKNQNCFNMVSVDTINKKLYINRYGYNPGVYNATVLDY